MPSRPPSAFPSLKRRTTRYRGSSTQQGYGGAWRKVRASIILRDPICTIDGCGPSVDVDHILARAKGGTEHPSNLRGVAHGCHSRVTVKYDGGFGNPHRAGK